MAYLVGAAAFIAVGFLLGAVVPTARAAQGLGLVLFFANMFLSGADGPRAIMPEWMQNAGEALPLTHVVTALQDPWLGFGWNWMELGIVAGVLAVAALVAVRLFRAPESAHLHRAAGPSIGAPRLSRRRCRGPS